MPTTSASDAWRYGLRASYRRRAGEARRRCRSASTCSARRRTSRRSGSLDIPPREGDIFVFGRPPGDDVNADTLAQPHRSTSAPYVFAEIALGPKLTIVPGLRIDGFLLEGSAIKPPVVGITPIGFSRLDWGVDPRLSVTYRAASSG